MTRQINPIIYVVCPKLDMILLHLSLSMLWIRFIPIILKDWLCYELKLSITSSIDNLVHAMKFPCFSNPLFILYQNDYKKRKLVLVLLLTFLLSLLMKIDKRVSASLMPQASKGLIFTQRKKGKSKGMGTHLLNQM